MLIEFTVGNFRSFKDKVTLSMETETKLSSANKSSVVSINGRYNLLTSTGIFGANASGKSNINYALHFMKNVVKGEQGDDLNSNLASQYSPFEPFLLDDTSKNKPIFMQIFLWDKKLKQEYCYGFEFKDKKFIKEWFYVRAKAKQRFATQQIFQRSIKYNKSIFEFKNKEIKTRLSQLVQFVDPSTSAIFIFKQFADPFASALSNLIDKQFITVSNLMNNQKNWLKVVINAFQQEANVRQRMLKMLRQADLYIQDIKVITSEKLSLQMSLSQKEQISNQLDGNTSIIRDIQILRKYHGSKKDQTVGFSLINHESTGTQKTLYLIAIMAQILERGGFAVIDDLDSGLHPLLVEGLVQQFNQKDSNPKGAQLIYNTHETVLMSYSAGLRYDQIWFTDKCGKFEATELIRLTDYKIRNDYKIDSNYIIGRFGAVPLLGF